MIGLERCMWHGNRSGLTPILWSDSPLGSKACPIMLLGKALEGILDSLKRDGFMPVRREALISQADTSADSGRGVWQEALLDGNASIRELARFHLGKLGEVNWPDVYRRALSDQPRSLAALSGLGETGDRSDLMSLRGSLVSRRPTRRRAAVRAFAKLGRESVVADLLGCLQDDSPAVIREVRNASKHTRPLSIVSGCVMWRCTTIVRR